MVTVSGSIKRKSQPSSAVLKSNFELAQQIGARKMAQKAMTESNLKKGANILLTMNPGSDESIDEADIDETNKTRHSEYLFQQSLGALRTAQADSQSHCYDCKAAHL